MVRLEFEYIYSNPETLAIILKHNNMTSELGSVVLLLLLSPLDPLAAEVIILLVGLVVLWAVQHNISK